MVAAGVGTVIAATIARLALTRARTQPDLVLLLVPAIPALLLGQLWTIGVLTRACPMIPRVGASWARPLPGVGRA